MGWAVQTIGSAALGYGALVGLAYALQRRHTYFPDGIKPEPVEAGAGDMEPVGLATADGLGLTAWYRPATEGRATLIYLHGNAGNIAMRVPKARPFIDAGFGMLLTSYRGYSGNPGRPTERGLYADGRAALAFLAEAGVPEAHIVLYGESLGTGVAVQLATERTVAAVVLEAPFTSIADVAAPRFPYLPVRRLIRDRFDSRAKIGNLHAPVLIFHGERDMTVPVRLGRALFAAAREPKEAAWLPYADHNDLYEHGAGAIVLAFLDRHLRG